MEKRKKVEAAPAAKPDIRESIVLAETISGLPPDTRKYLLGYAIGISNQPLVRTLDGRIG